jgi:hypothetical protein
MGKDHPPGHHGYFPHIIWRWYWRYHTWYFLFILNSFWYVNLSFYLRRFPTETCQILCRGKVFDHRSYWRSKLRSPTSQRLSQSYSYTNSICSYRKKNLSSNYWIFCRSNIELVVRLSNRQSLYRIMQSYCKCSLVPLLRTVANRETTYAIQ